MYDKRVQRLMNLIGEDETTLTRGSNRSGASAASAESLALQDKARNNPRVMGLLDRLGMTVEDLGTEKTVEDVQPFRADVNKFRQQVQDVYLPSQLQGNQQRYGQLQETGSELTAMANAQDLTTQKDVFQGNYTLQNLRKQMNQQQATMGGFDNDMDYIKSTTPGFDQYMKYLETAGMLGDEKLERDILTYGMERTDENEGRMTLQQINDEINRLTKEITDAKNVTEPLLDPMGVMGGIIAGPVYTHKADTSAQEARLAELWRMREAGEYISEDAYAEGQKTYLDRYKEKYQQGLDEEYAKADELRLQAMMNRQNALEAENVYDEARKGVQFEGIDAETAEQVTTLNQNDERIAQIEEMLRMGYNPETMQPLTADEYDALIQEQEMLQSEMNAADAELKRKQAMEEASIAEQRMTAEDEAKALDAQADQIIEETQKKEDEQQALYDSLKPKRNWGRYIGTGLLKGASDFSNALYQTYDAILGRPVDYIVNAGKSAVGKAFGTDTGEEFRNPLSDFADKYKAVNEGYTKAAEDAAKAMGTSEWWRTGQQVIGGLVQNIPNALMAFLTGGASAGVTGAQQAAQATMKSVGNSKIVNAVADMITDPQYWTSFAQSMGSDYNDAYEESKDPMKSALYAMASSLLNAGIEIGFSGNSGIQGLGKAIEDGDVRGFMRILKAGGDEYAEEVKQGITSGVMKKIIYDADKKLISATDNDAIISPELVESAEIGGLTGLLLGGSAEIANSAADAARSYNAQKKYADAIAALEQETAAAEQGEAEAAETQTEANEAPQEAMVVQGEAELTGEDTAYLYGLEGRSQEDLINTLEEAGIEVTDKARAAFTRGETQRQVEKQQQMQRIREANQGGKVAKRKGVFRSVTAEEATLYNVKTFSGVLSDKQKAAVKAMRGIAEKMHLNIAYFESPVVDGVRKGANGFYDSKTNTVYLDVFAGQGNEQAMMRAGAHELTHVIQEWSPDKYTKLQDMLFKYYYSTGKNTLNEMIQAQKDKAKANGLELTEREALDEVTADACEMMFSDIDAMREIARTDKTLFEKIGEWINKFVDSIRQAMEGLRGSTEESRLLMESKETWENARKIWYQALEEAGQNNPGSVTETAKTVDQTAEIAENVQKPVVKKAVSVVKIENQPVQIADGAAEVIKGAAVKNSLRTWTEDERTAVKENLKKQGFKEKDVKEWIHDVDGIAAQVAKDKDRLDFTAADNQVMLKNNQEYVKTLDASTLCAKRLVYQGTFNAVQHALPDRVMTSDDLIDLRNLMAKKGYETPCGICYVESRRRHLGKFADEWVQSYQGEYKPHLDDVTTTDGLERLRKEHPEAYNSFMAAMKKKGSNNPKVVELRTEYRGDIRKLTNAQIKKIREIGGLRVQSFSDFETPHLMDMMQAVLDMAAKGLTSQAYTKVPNFAAVFGDTGIKINLSLIAEGSGLDEDGNLLFSSYEGMDFDRAMELREQYSENVGTILVGLNDAHIKAAMADDRIDFIIPFHKSGWGQEQMARLSAIRDYEDYTDTQNERKIIGYRKNGNPIYKNVESNFYPVDYWDFSVSGTENAENYLRMCAEDGRIPKFNQFLVDNGDGSYSLPEDGSADGYWKMLIDYKMYDNDGVGAPQRAVQPVFNMEEADRVLREYEGGADTLPVAKDVVSEFVDQLKKNDASVQYSLRDAASPVKGRVKDQTETAQFRRWFKGSKVVNADGTPKAAYHGTPSYGFTVFDKNLMGKGTDQFGAGFYFATDKNAAERYGDKQYEVYLNIKKPIKIERSLDGGDLFEVEITPQQAYQILKRRPDIMDREESPLGDYIEEYWSEGPKDWMIREMAKNFSTIGDLDSDRSAFREYPNELHEAIRDVMGYDGVEVSFDNTKEKFYVAWFPEQIKSATDNIGTFDASNPDIRYSQRDTEYKTDRELLATALESAAVTEEEQQMLKEYQQIAADIDNYDERVRTINQKIREIRKNGGKWFSEEEVELVKEREGLEKKIEKADKKLMSMYEMRPIRQLANRQRKKFARERLDKYKEGVIQREYIGKIKRTSDKLAKWLTKPNNQRYVPEDLRRPLAEFLLAIDRGSETMLTGGGMTQADRDYARVVADLRDVVSNISAYQNDQSESGKVYSMYIDLPRGFVEMMTEHARKMDAKAQEMGGRMTLNRMNAQELEELFMTLTAIASSITHTNDFLSTENAKRVGEVAQDTIGYLREQKPIVTESKIGEFLNWDNLQPVYAFERYGEGGKQIFRMLQDGQSKLAFNTQEIVKEAEKLYTAKEAKAWSEEIKTFTIGGKEVRIPVANIMSLYCLTRRQQGIGHLYGEGIRVGDFKDGIKTVRDGGHNIGDADIARMVDSLTERQRDVAKKLQQVMSTKGSRWGNEISMKRFGYRMFTEKNYFPIEVDRTHLPARTDNGRGNELYRLLNISSTKPITRGANNRIMLNNIFDVFSSHMSDMAQYNAMALPVLDAVKWLNYKESELEEIPLGEEKEYRQKYTESVRDAARDAYGYAANKYIIGVLRDINGAQMTGGEGYGKMMLGRVNRASVAANLRVAFLQPLSIIRAGTVLKGTDILTGAGIGATHIKRNLKEMEEHSGIAVWKQLGFYDVNIGRSVSKLIKHDETKMDKLIDASMKGAEWADRMTWALMWEGAKRDVARTTSPSSEGFLDKVAERFEEVVYKTQVVDSVLTRSQYMRNPGFFAKWTSSFMSEPTTTYNMLLNAYSKFTTEARNTNFQKAWQKTGRMVLRTMGVYTVTAAINALVESLVGAWRDEDDYKTFTEKFQDGYYDNYINNIMPFNKLPLVSDVYEYAKKSLALFGVDTYGYGDTNVITQWLDQLYAGLEIVAAKVNGDPTNYTDYGAIYKLMQGISSLTGVPMASAMREAVAMWNNTVGALTKNKIVVYKTSKSQGYQQMYNAIMDENTERTEQIRTELKENGAEDKSIISGLRSLAKQDYMAGNLTDDEAAAFLQKHCGMSADEAYWKLDEWAWDDEADAEDYSVYNELEEALLTGTGISEAVKRLMDHGYEKSKVQSKVRELVKAGYLNGDLTQAKVKSLLKAHGGLTDDEVYFKQQQYEYERLTGDSTSSDACMIFYAIDNKKSPEAAIDAAMKHGKTKSGIAASLTNRYKEQYLELLKNNKSAAYQLATRLAGIFDYLGYEGTKKVQGWTETK